eukprot:s392_g27.t1
MTLAMDNSQQLDREEWTISFRRNSWLRETRSRKIADPLSKGPASQRDFFSGNVVIINFPDTGHINPTLPLVAELASRVKVTYFLPQQFRSEMLEHYLHPDAPPEEFEFPLCTLAVAAWILPDLVSELKAMQPPPGAEEGWSELDQFFSEFTLWGKAGAMTLEGLVACGVYQKPGQPSPHVDGVQAYTVSVCQSDAQPLGLVVTEPKPPMRNLLILQADSEVIRAWNFVNHQRRIQAGHAIMAVNGKTDPFEMLQELASSLTLELFIKDKLTRLQQRYFDESVQALQEQLVRQLQMAYPSHAMNATNAMNAMNAMSQGDHETQSEEAQQRKATAEELGLQGAGKAQCLTGVIVYDPFLPHGLVAAHVLGIPAEFYSPDLNLVTTIPEFFAPPRLSPQLKRFGNFPFHCVGPLVNTKLKRVAHAALGDSAEAPLPWDVIDKAIAQSKRLVFLSMGTVATGGRWSESFGPLAAHNGIQNCTGKEFLQRVWRIAFQALGGEEDLLVLMVEAPSNFIIRQTVPQLDVLKRCRAFITHGGNNSIHEALAFAVPMAVIPMFGDQPYNSDAVAGLGCGFSFRYPLQTLNAERLRKAVRGLLMEPSYHCAAMQMSQKLCCASGSESSAMADAEKKEEPKVGEKRKDETATEESKRLKPTPPDPAVVRKQVEYYLSDENLKYDKFFHEKIAENTDGWLDMTLILQCNKMKTMRATKVRQYLRAHAEMGSRVEIPEVEVRLAAGLSCASLLITGLCSQPIAPCPVCHLFLAQLISLVSQIMGARALSDLTFFQTDEYNPGDDEAMADEMDTLETELQQLPEDLAQWMCAQPVPQGVASDRTLEAAVSMLTLAADTLEGQPLESLRDSLAAVRPRVVEIQTRSALNATPFPVHQRHTPDQ